MESDRSPASRYVHRLLVPPHQGIPVELCEAHPWLDAYASSRGAAVAARIWREWYAWTTHPTSTIPGMPQERDGGYLVPWSRTAAADVDGQDLAVLLHRIAEGTEPVWERAAWRVDGHGIPSIPRRAQPALLQFAAG